MAQRPSTMRMGPVSLFALIIVLCLAVLAVLSIASANASREMTYRQADFIADEYSNETAGQLLYAEADGIVSQVRAQGGGANAAAAALKEGADRLEAAAQNGSASPAVTVTVEGTELTAHIQAESGRCLDILLKVSAGPALSVESWTASTLWTEDTTDTLWMG